MAFARKLRPIEDETEEEKKRGAKKKEWVGEKGRKERVG